MNPIFMIRKGVLYKWIYASTFTTITNPKTEFHQNLPMDAPNDPGTRPPSRLAWTLGAIFLFALLMGPGPGLYLINDYAAKGGTLLGAPALYAWAVFWLAVESIVVVIAYRKLWKDEAE